MVLTRMKDAEFDFSKMVAVSGTAQVLSLISTYWLMHIVK